MVAGEREEEEEEEQSQEHWRALENCHGNSTQHQSLPHSTDIDGKTIFLR
jgi:hypothetical protein